jgi:hypothetical protein
MRIAVNGANKPDQRTEVVLAAEPAIQLVCSTNVMCYIGKALEYTAPESQYTTPLEIAHDHAFIGM